MITVKSLQLKPDDCFACFDVANHQAENNKRDGSVECAPNISRRNRFAFLGALGEVALCRYLGIEPNFDRMKSSEGRGDIDVDNLWEVRATEPNSCGMTGSPLTLYKHNLNKRKTYFSPFVKVCVRFVREHTPVCTFHGWEMGYIIVNEEKLKPRRIGTGSDVVERDDRLLRPFVSPTHDRELALFLKQQWITIDNNINEKIF